MTTHYLKGLLLTLITISFGFSILPPPTLTIVSITNNGDLTATVVAEGGETPYTYEWSDGQTTDLAIGLTDGLLYYVTVTDALDSIAIDSVLIINELLCDAGTMTTTGTIITCNDTSVPVQNDDMHEVPLFDNGSYGWFFDNALGGSGGFEGPFTLLEIENPSSTSYNRDLNGLLSTYNFPPMEGTWTIRGVVYQDMDTLVQGIEICSMTTDSIVITFAESPNTIATNNTDGTATATSIDGTTPYTYEWSDGQITETAVNLTTGTYTVTVTEGFGCSTIDTVDVTISALNETVPLENVAICPNPTNGNFQINLTLNTTEVVSVEVLDVVGRKVQSIATSTITNKVYNIDLNNESQGIYIVRLNIGDKVLMRRVVLNK